MTDSKNIFLKIFYPVVEFVNKIDSRLLIFLILCLNLLSFNLHTNEEAYFSLAMQYMDPNWIPGSFTFTEWVGTRLLFQTITGFALKFLSFEQVAFWARLFNILVYSFPLALIFKELKIKNIGILIILQIFALNLNTQHFFGQEWIFRGFEAKTLAYIFIFYSFYYILKSRYMLVALFAAIASYFHILVGGWFFVMVFIYALVREQNIKLSFKMGLTYVGIVSPFIAYLALYINGSGSIINGVDIDWVSVFFRNAHHVAPMHSRGAMTGVLPRVIVSFILSLVSIFYFRKSTSENIRKLNTIAIVCLCMIFTGLIITHIDHNGRILKYYLFRIASIGAFSYYLLIFLFFRDKFDKWFNPQYVKSIAILIMIPFFLESVVNNIASQVKKARNEKDLIELASYFKENTKPEDVYLFLNRDELSFSRRTRREAWVIFKFDPGGGEKIYEWYMRSQAKIKLQEDISYIDTITQKYKLDYLITDEQTDYKNLKEVYHNNKYHLYEIVKSE